MSYVDGDYRDSNTYTSIGSAPHAVQSKRPSHYLAIPPRLFPTVVEGLGKARCPPHPRLILQKPLGRDLASPPQPNPPPRLGLPAVGAVPHGPVLRQGGGGAPVFLPVRELVPRADLEPQLRREHPDHDGRELRGARPGPLLRGGRRAARRRPEPHAADGGNPGDGAPRRRRGRGAAPRDAKGVQ